jgi:hypothetical protein
LLLLAGLGSALRNQNRLQADARRLQARYETEKQDKQRLGQELAAVRSQARRSEEEAKDLLARNQGTLQQLQQHEQLKDELEKFQQQSLKFLERTLLATAVGNNLNAYRVVRTCNKAGTRLSYQYLDEDTGTWSEPMILGPNDCITRWLAGYHAQVPVRFSSLKDDLTVEDKALAGMVVGPMAPDTDKDWRPWENQIVSSQDAGLELKSVYSDNGVLGGSSHVE